MASTDNQRNALMRLLKQGPIDRPAAAQNLGISQPTFSRLWPSIDDGIALGAARARKYALRRRIAGVAMPIPVFLVSELGHAVSIGVLEALAGGWFALTVPDSHRYTLFQGMPFFLRDLRPQGFLGRMEPAKNKDLELPENILMWSDDHVLKFLVQCSAHAFGNILIGNESYRQFLAALRPTDTDALVDQDRSKSYPLMAERAMQGDPPGSSAGGEQPKFTHIILSGVAKHEAAPQHVIVKFSPRSNSASGLRWADLLVCEHLALNVLLKNEVAAASTSIFEIDRRVFLEVIRFDRTGAAGRLPMLTFAGLDGELGMLDQNWTAVAHELGRQGLLSLHDQKTVEILDLYGALIGNTDKHHGNIAVAWTFGAPYRLLPSYDMLPMLYRPNAHGEVIQRSWDPKSVSRLALRHLPFCFNLAQQFWHEVLDDARISNDFKTVALKHLQAIKHLNPNS